MSTADAMFEFFIGLFKAVVAMISDFESPLFYSYGVILGFMILLFVAALFCITRD